MRNVSLLGRGRAPAVVAWHRRNAAAWDAATFLSQASAASPGGDFRAAVVEVCPTDAPSADVIRVCAPPSTTDARLQRASLLSWPVATGVVVTAAPGQGVNVVATLRAHATREDAVLGAVVASPSADLEQLGSVARSLVVLASHGKDGVPDTLRLLATKPDSTACSAVVRAASDSIVVTPKLSAFVRASELEDEIHTVLASVTPMPRWARWSRPP